MQAGKNPDDGGYIFIRHSESEYIRVYEDRVAKEHADKQNGIQKPEMSRVDIEIRHNKDAL